MLDCACFGSFAMQGVCSEGANSTVELENCSIHSHFEACVAALSSGFVSAKKCQIYKSERSRGISIEGVGSKAEINNCSIYQCYSACICVLGSAQCQVSHSELRDTIGSSSQCVCVQGYGSKCVIQESSISDSSGTCVVALAGGCVMLHDSRISGSVTMQGISSQGNDSAVIAENCSISNTREACVGSLRGGLVRMTKCMIAKSLSRGISVEGASVVELFGCKIELCFSSCAVVVDGGMLFASNSIFQQTVGCHGQGICVEGSSSKVSLIDCNILKIAATGIACSSGASVHLDNCTVFLCGLQGCSSEGKGSSVVAKHSRFAKCDESACTSVAGAFMNLIGCEMIESLYGLICEGSGTSVILDTCTIFKNEQCGVITVDGGSATIMASHITNESQGIVCRGLGSRLLMSICTIENTTKCAICALDGGYVTLRSCKILRSSKSHLLVAQGPESTVKATDCTMQSSFLACVVAIVGGSITMLKCNASDSSSRQIILSHGPKSVVVSRESQIHSAFGACVLAMASGTCALSSCLVHSSKTMQGVCADGPSSHISMVKCVVQECKNSLTLACGGGLVELDDCRLLMPENRAVCSQNPKSILRIQGCVIDGSIASLRGGSLIVSNSCSNSQILCIGSGSFVNMQTSSISSSCTTGLLVSDSASVNVEQCMLNLSEVQVQGRNSSVVINQSVISGLLKAGAKCFNVHACSIPLAMTHSFAGLSGVAQVTNCKIGKGSDNHVLVADGASTRIDVESCFIRLKNYPQDAYVEQKKSCFQLVSRPLTSKLSDALKSAIWCDHISFSNPLLQHSMKRRMSTGSVISLCDVSEDKGVVFDSFIQNFPHLPQPATAAAEIEKEKL
jgi:hypothetical protein